ncbi:hypothetical protein [Desulfobulbus alkaliphilus]|uniref:hypothetical protein n=1 Tax=Desulfobulbus alkaliphilus TaxID=869814 RepID=UPI00196616B6|nr:hypothetical protein [Desulfobulbus alkaliphilus]MBM9536483.1 hypothetical protein [Desulfobulbus alkaliphilus]
MYSEKQLCDKIRSLYPEIGACGIDIDVNYNDKEQAWLVTLKKDAKELKHYLNLPDADGCMEGKQCVSLGLEIAQLRKHLEREGF